jgi:serine/threonine protein kinase
VTEPSSCHNALPHNVKSVIVKQQKDGWASEFQREKEAYKALEDLQGTVIPQLFGEGSLNGIPAIILSEVAGSTLSELARNGVEVREDMLQGHLNDALSVLNQYGAEYSDLRPDNFMICDNGRVVILDPEDVSFSWKPEESAFEDCGNLGDAGYLMSGILEIQIALHHPSTYTEVGQ